MVRTPTLREVRAAGHPNVTILPTTSPRKVRQNRNSAAARARIDLWYDHGERFPYVAPVQRRADQAARILNSIDRSPAIDVLHAMMLELPNEARLAIIDRLRQKHAEHPDDYATAQAYTFARCHALTYGEQSLIERALNRIREAEA